MPKRYAGPVPSPAAIRYAIREIISSGEEMTPVDFATCVFCRARQIDEETKEKAGRPTGDGRAPQAPPKHVRGDPSGALH